MEELKQPEWCYYADATRPYLGCWALLAGRVTSEEYCKNCDCYKDKCYDKERGTHIYK